MCSGVWVAVPHGLCLCVGDSNAVYISSQSTVTISADVCDVIDVSECYVALKILLI